MSISDGVTLNDLPVSAKATFTTGDDSITVVIENLQVDPRSFIQCLSGLLFTLNSGQTVGTLIESSAVLRTVALDGTYTDGPGPVTTDWDLGSTIIGLSLYGMDAAEWPAYRIIGPPPESNVYDNSNGSIAGNKPHNAFLGENATFVLNVPGVTDASRITDVTFEFGTSPGNTVTIPEPATMSLLTLGGLLILRRRRRS